MMTLLQMRDAQISRCVPDLFDYHTLLYVGAKIRYNYPMFRGQDGFDKAGYEIDVVEVSPKNAAALRRMNEKGHQFKNTWRPPGSFRYVIEGDVRNIESLTDEDYDVVMWWQGPEHVHLKEVESALAALWRKTRHLLVLGCPCAGVTDEHPMAGDGATGPGIHYSRFDREFFIGLGFEVDVVGECGKRGNNMMAWRRR